jgi:hypothetical protein
LYLQKWIRPFVDTSQWEFYDLSCRSRDDTDDQVLADCIAAGKRIGAIYKGMFSFFFFSVSVFFFDRSIIISLVCVCISFFFLGDFGCLCYDD